MRYAARWRSRVALGVPAALALAAARRPARRAAGPRRLGSHPVRPRDADRPSGTAALADDDLGDGRAVPGARHPAGLVPGPVRAPGDELGARPAHGSARAATGRRRRGPPHGVGTQRGHRAVPDALRHPDPVHDRGRRARRDLRRDALLRARRRGRDARPRPAARVGGADPRSERPALPPDGRHPARAAGHRRAVSRSRGPGRSASSVRRSPSPATSRAARRPCRSSSTSSWSATRRWRSRSASCCWASACWCSACSAGRWLR